MDLEALLGTLIAAQFGAVRPPGFRDWLQRAQVVLATQPDEASRSAYVNWIAQQVSAARGVADWRAVDLLPARSPMVADEEQRAAALYNASRNRLQQIYAAAPASIPPVLEALGREFSLIRSQVASGQIRSYFALGSEEIVARVMRPHPVPPVPPHMASQRLLPSSGPPVGINPPLPTQTKPRQPPSSDARPPHSAEPITLEKIRRRMELFGGSGAGSANEVVGSSSALERRYTREEPRPEEIRPQRVLLPALAHIIDKFYKIECGELSPFQSKSNAPSLHPRWDAARWLSEQLKGMRQDIKVQMLGSPIAVGAYEVHARLCLRIGDPLEFNACQATLRNFYVGGASSEGGSDAAALADALKRAPTASTRTGLQAKTEFTAYRALYTTLNGQHGSQAAEDQKRVVENESRDVDAEQFCRTVSRLSRALDRRDGVSARRAVLDLHAFPDLIAGVAGVIGPALQRLRVQWLFAGAANGALRGQLSATLLRAWMGMPVLDDVACQHTLGHINTGPGVHDAEAAWHSLWKTLSVTQPDAGIDGNQLAKALSDYTGFLSGGSSGATITR